MGITSYHLDSLKSDVIFWENGTKREEKDYGDNNKLVQRLVYYANGKLAIKQLYSIDNKLINGEYLDMDGKPAKI